MKMFLEFLRTSKKDKKAIAIRTDELDWDEAHVGFIVDFNKKSILMEAIDANGRIEGKIEIDPLLIISIDYNDRYLRRLDFLHKNKFEHTIPYTHVYTNHGISQKLVELEGSSSVCTLFFEDDYYVTGLVVQVDDTHIKMNNIGVEGDDDGNSVYFLDSIESVRYNSEEEMRIEKLYKNRSNFYF